LLYPRPAARALPQSGCADIVVGREDGWLEVWDVDEAGLPQKVRAAINAWNNAASGEGWPRPCGASLGESARRLPAVATCSII
jgi:hypothetical protein